MINRIAEYSTDDQRSTPPSAAPLAVDWRQWVASGEELIAKYPGACLASAFVIGAVVAWWIKRR
jgi:hypothetical protein